MAGVFGVLTRERGRVRNALRVVAVLERRARSEHPGAIARRAARERDRALGQLLGAVRDARVRERAPLGAERVGSDGVDAARDVVGVDLAHELRVAVERARRPERQPRRDAAPLELGAGRAIDDQRGVGAQARFESGAGQRHAPILARSMAFARLRLAARNLRSMPAAPALAVFCDFDGTFAAGPRSGPASSAARSPPGSTTSRSSKGCPWARTCSRRSWPPWSSIRALAACSHGARSDRCRSGSSPTASTATSIVSRR